MSERIFKTCAARIIERIYGIRGSIEPPMKYGRLYPLRFQWWKVSSAIYRWSGLPEKWLKWRTGAENEHQ